MKSLVVAAVRKKDQWRGALIVDNEFKDALIESSVLNLVVDALGPILAAEMPEGTEVSVNLSVRQKDDKPSV